MADDTRAALLSKLLDSVPVLLIVLGVAACLLGLAGGLSYHSWFEIKEPISRIAASFLGLGLIATGVIQSRFHTHRHLRPQTTELKSFTQRQETTSASSM